MVVPVHTLEIILAPIPSRRLLDSTVKTGPLPGSQCRHGGPAPGPAPGAAGGEAAHFHPMFKVWHLLSGLAWIHNLYLKAGGPPGQHRPAVNGRSLKAHDGHGRPTQ